MIVRGSNPRACFFWALAALTLATESADAKTITRYEPYFALCTSAYTLTTLIALRICEIDSETHLLLVDPATLTTTLLPAYQFHIREMPIEQIHLWCGSSAYGEALADARQKADTLADAGLTHLKARRSGIDLTVDLCPSRHSLDRNFFLDLIQTLGKNDLPAPIAIAVTGLWIKEHPDDMEWLLKNVEENTFSITWINHSYHHRFNKGDDERANFLLEKGTDVRQEILLTEKTLLALGAVPSVFFRFPGLISNQALFNLVVSFGLIPVGSDAWLAKNERPTDGSIVLVHANGNEPLGIQRFLKLLREEKEAQERQQWLLLDLRESVVETEENKVKK